MFTKKKDTKEELEELTRQIIRLESLIKERNKKPKELIEYQVITHRKGITQEFNILMTDFTSYSDCEIICYNNNDIVFQASGLTGYSIGRINKDDNKDN